MKRTLYVLCTIAMIGCNGSDVELKENDTESLHNFNLAKAYIDNGALIIDVRTSARYSQKQLEGTVNFPIGSVVQSIQSLVQEKPRTILCHCESGGLSAIAVSQLRRAGYKESFNLGSYRRAAALLRSEQ